MGYRTVAVSTSDAKKDLATKLGANDYVDTSKEDAAEALQKIGGAALVVITAPNPKVMSPMIDACAPGGKLLILARKCLLHTVDSSILTMPLTNSILLQLLEKSLLTRSR